MQAGPRPQFLPTPAPSPTRLNPPVAQNPIAASSFTFCPRRASTPSRLHALVPGYRIPLYRIVPSLASV